MFKLKNLIFLFLFVFTNMVWAGEAILFNMPELTVYSEHGRMVGFYNLVGVFDHPCYFLFQQISKNGNINEKVGDYSVSDISVFIPDSKSEYFEDRFRNFHTDGKLYRSDKVYTSTAKDGTIFYDHGRWVITMASPPTTCYHGNVNFFKFSPPNDGVTGNSVERKMPAIGIRLANSRAVFYDFRKGQFISRKSYLVAGDGVIVLRQHGVFSFVRYTDPRVAYPEYARRVITGWVHTSDLVNPFLPEGK